MVTFKELKRLYKKALDEHQNRVIVEDEFGRNVLPIIAAKKIIDNLENDHAPDDAMLGLADMSRLSPEAQEAFKRVGNRIRENFKQSMSKEYDIFRKGFEIQSIEVTEKLNPIWKEMGIQEERAFLETMVQRAEHAVEKCDCIELLMYTDSVNQAKDVVMDAVAGKLHHALKNKTMTEDEIKSNLVTFSSDFSEVGKRMYNCIKTFAITCNCQKTVVK